MQQKINIFREPNTKKQYVIVIFSTDINKPNF